MTAKAFWSRLYGNDDFFPNWREDAFRFAEAYTADLRKELEMAERFLAAERHNHGVSIAEWEKAEKELAEAREQLKAQEWISVELRRKALAKDSSTDEWSCWCEVCCEVRNVLAAPPQGKGERA